MHPLPHLPRVSRSPCAASLPPAPSPNGLLSLSAASSRNVTPPRYLCNLASAPRFARALWLGTRGGAMQGGGERGAAGATDVQQKRARGVLEAGGHGGGAQRWRRDVLGNVVFRPLLGCTGPLCFDFDHIVPFAKGGTSDVHNCQVLQVAANRAKGSVVSDSWRQDAQPMRTRQPSGEDMDVLELAAYGDIDAWRAKFPDATEFPNWVDLLRRDVPIFDLDYEAILAAMYALSVSAKGDCYLCVPPDPGITPGIAPAALGACESAPLGTAPAHALHTFTLDSGASHCFFRDSTTVTPLPAPVLVSLADPSGGPVLARSSTVLPCPAVPSGELSSLHLPSFSTNLGPVCTPSPLRHAPPLCLPSCTRLLR
ncbi:unnamed protein product [Closterium sp. NIES-53]